MKRNLFTFAIMTIAIMATAQSTKKVAILETVDREDNISYGIKLVLRSNLAKAITNTPGYEAYDRTDMDAIVGEQNFQRTGMVSNEQIKKLGEMTGAQYVLVAEAVMLDNNTLYIIAKLLDVETARIEATDNEMMITSIQEIQRGCQSLAKKLIAAESTGNKQTIVANTKDNDNIEAREGYMISSGYTIERVSNNEYRLGDTKMDKKQYKAFLYRNCPAAWRKYNGGQNSIIAGWVFFGTGLAFASMSFIEPEIFLPIGMSMVVFVSVPLLSAGYPIRSNAYKTYNKYCSNSEVSLNFQASSNGVGLALNF